MVSIITAQHDLLLSTLRHITQTDWKVLVVDAASKTLVDNVIEQDELLNLNITNIEQITDRRQTNKEVEAIYLLSPQPWIVDCLMADFEKRKYRRAHLVWTSLLHPALRDRIDKSPVARPQIALFKVLNTSFHPQESHLVTLRSPESFPILFHPGCNHLVRAHMEDLAQKIVGVCVSLGEYPTIRYYRPREARHEAAILCSHLARFVQDELDLYAKFHEDFPPATSRTRGVLFITDRSMDLVAPVVHEFTYQAMANDLLSIREKENSLSYRTLINPGTPQQEDKEIAIEEKDKIWTENRHRHMKDTIDRLMADFQRFIKSNPNFTKDSEGGANSLNAIKDMLAGLPEFQSMKEAYALHLGMAQECMDLFQQRKLAELGSVEQTLATGWDEEYKRPKGVADQVVRMLDEPSILPPDRLRLLALYMLYRDGILRGDLEKLIAHANLSPQDHGTLTNLSLLGARIERQLKDKRPPPNPLFTPKPPPINPEAEYALSRYEPALQLLLENHASGTVSSESFPYTRPPPLDESESLSQVPTNATSLRQAKPTWAKSRTATNTNSETRQRVVVFMAGGATYSESRVCYEVGAKTGREVVLVTSHMLSPEGFLRQVGELGWDKRRLDLPVERSQPKAPGHLFEPDVVPRAAAVVVAAPVQQQPVQRQGGQVPTREMGGLNVNGRAQGGSGQQQQANSSAKLTKDPPGGSGAGGGTGPIQLGGEKKEKKHRFLGLGKKGRD
ncbi:syntaxin binding protein 1 [Elasticomyces elasticus]|nr:syntaxin binding protein 1 [Elasticomyces elasticus]KAK4970587.1 syntaxin binding protein 1 [Elasticomyces elasticus]